MFVALLAAWAFWYEPSSLTVNHYAVTMREIPPNFNNLKIVAISDIHGGSNFIDEAKIQKVVELANAEQPDVIVLLGDYVSQTMGRRSTLKMPMNVVADNLRGLRAKYGVFAIVGNHDLYFGERETVAELERVGITVLNGAATRVVKDDQTLILLGLSEVLKIKTWPGYVDEARTSLAKINARDDEPIIALVHNPDAFPLVTAPNNRVSPNLQLVLAGHTHGGQCSFPIIGAPMIYLASGHGQKYVRGLIQENDSQMFVTVGIGTSLLPVRFRVPPEIAVITLNR